MELKYVRHSTIGFIVWPRTDALWHSDIGVNAIRKAGGKIISAGFCSLEGGAARCWGRSESLDVGGLPDDETAMNAQFGLQPNDKPSP